MDIPITDVKKIGSLLLMLRRKINNTSKTAPQRKNRALNPKIDKRNTTKNYSFRIETP
jgi:hypothetical protein